tara:strand:- start:301 stop:606 length:306 start_codon:yes stop_codon:yes gene_type:complete
VILIKIGMKKHVQEKVAITRQTMLTLTVIQNNVFHVPIMPAVVGIHLGVVIEILKKMVIDVYLQNAVIKINYTYQKVGVINTIAKSVQSMQYVMVQKLSTV